MYAYMYVYIYIYIYTHTCGLALLSAATCTIFKTPNHIGIRCEVPTSSVLRVSQLIVSFKPHILKHHIPELPMYVRCWRPLDMLL